MTRRITITHAGQRFGLRQWQEDPSVGCLTVDWNGQSPDRRGLAQVLVRAHREGFRRLQTNALVPPDATTFAEAGFAPIEELLVLELDLRFGETSFAAMTPELQAPYAMAGLRPRSFEETLRVDARAFERPWRMDRTGLTDAFAATARARGRVVRREDRIVGYGIVGLSDTEGFIQRLAVDPLHQGQGIASAVLVDGLRWLCRRGARRAVVNTHENNTAARSLYRRFGFVELDAPLTVLAIDVATTRLSTTSSARQNRRSTSRLRVAE